MLSPSVALETEKPNLVLLHGWGYDSACWPAAMLQSLRSKYTLILLDLPGHGQDTFVIDGGDNIAQLDEWIVAAKQKLPCQYHVLGWSLGAQVAIRMAHYDAGVQSLILMATNPKFMSSSDWPRAMLPDLLAQFQQGYDTLANKTIRRFASLQAQGSLTPKLQAAHMVSHMQVSIKKRFGLQLLAQLDEREHLCQLTQPCYLELAKDDALVPWRWVGQLSLPDVQVNYVEGGHGYLLEQHSVTQAMAEFLHLEVGL